MRVCNRAGVVCPCPSGVSHCRRNWNRKLLDRLWINIVLEDYYIRSYPLLNLKTFVSQCFQSIFLFYVLSYIYIYIYNTCSCLALLKYTRSPTLCTNRQEKIQNYSPKINQTIPSNPFQGNERLVSITPNHTKFHCMAEMFLSVCTIWWNRVLLTPLHFEFKFCVKHQAILTSVTAWMDMVRDSLSFSLVNLGMRWIWTWF